ncbi:MAG: XkdW protein [Chthoniobacter sp.]|jgi:hypothetical protein|nr:XkdW protein [Chthoniobacter sp.]
MKAKLYLLLALIVTVATHAAEPSLGDAIRQFAPAAVPVKDYLVRDDSDGRGPQLVQWNAALGPQPTAADIATAKTALTAARATAAAKVTAETTSFSALSDKLDAGNLSAAELRQVLTLIVARLRKLER